MNLHKRQLYLLKQHSKSFNSKSAIVIDLLVGPLISPVAGLIKGWCPRELYLPIAEVIYIIK